MAEPWFDPEGLRICELEGRVAGFCWTKLFTWETPVLGEIHVICVHPDFAGRHLGRGLVLAGLEHLHATGATVGMLFVEADNDAALELYRKLDFAIVRTDRAFATTVRRPPPGEHALRPRPAGARRAARRPARPTGSAQVWDGLYRQARLPAEMTDLPRALRERLAEPAPPALELVSEAVADGGLTIKSLWEGAGGARVESVLMHYPQRSHRVRVEPGRLRHGLRLLRHRAGGLPAPPARRRDRRAGDGRGPPRPAPAPRQRRADGHGRAPRQLRRGLAGPPPPPHRRRPQRPPPHDLDRRPRPRHPAPGRRTGAGEPGGLAARGTRRAAGPAGARSTGAIRSTTCWPPARTTAGPRAGGSASSGRSSTASTTPPATPPSWRPPPARSGPT